MDIIVSDFDNTLFKRNYGLISENVEYLESMNLPVYIVTYRAEDQYSFISQQLGGTKINVIGYGFAGSRKQDPQTKLDIIAYLSTKYNIVEVLDDDQRVVLGWNK